MGTMLGFSRQRAALLREEALRIVSELPGLGCRGAYLLTTLGEGAVGPATALELVIVHETAEPFRRRSDFFLTHIRPRVGTVMAVYTPAEFTALRDEDPLLRRALAAGEAIDEPA